MYILCKCTIVRITYTLVYMYLPPLVLKARHLGGSAFCNVDRLGVPEQALSGIPLDFGIVMEDELHDIV